MSAHVEKVIITELSARGNGKDIIFRRIKQFWSLDGELLGETDPYPVCPKCGKQYKQEEVEVWK